MNTSQYVFTLEAETERDADVQARGFVDNLREINGIRKADRTKKSEHTMDLGNVISVLATSGAGIALAQGISDWLRSRRTTKLIIERDGSTNSLKAVVEKIDPESAKQIIELIRDA